ncbi:alpha/beta fold hydrolase [Alloalcanivorax mobilis]|uniref:alpha/beta fold hydrolase n=1 Tax=Alloalcanivorax mobilis TaxID=2019569 RepID=UPI000D52A6FF|nr:alpha/beta fold hydrolase [Alloalcanivorax mobilis]
MNSEGGGLDAGLLRDRASEADAVVLLAHGAGAPMDSPFMTDLAKALARRRVSVIRFEFPYMARRRRDGVKAPPSRMPALLDHFNQLYERVAAGSRLPVWVAGKSMGGRVATLLAAQRDVPGCLVFGYPFHPPGKPVGSRLAHFPELRAPVLICQGERDPFGRREEVNGYSLPRTVTLRWIAEGDHDFTPRRRGGLSWEHNLGEAADAAARFVLR